MKTAMLWVLCLFLTLFGMWMMDVPTGLPAWRWIVGCFLLHSAGATIWVTGTRTCP